MLILTRKPGESVIVEESVRITVLEVRGSQVKLGIQAPQEVRVNREEVLERQRAEANLPPLDTLPAFAAPPRARERAGAPEAAVERPAPARTEPNRRGTKWQPVSPRRIPAERAGAGGELSSRTESSSAGRGPSGRAPSSADRRPAAPRPVRGRPDTMVRPAADQPDSEPDLPAGSMRRYRSPAGRRPFARRWTPSPWAPGASDGDLPPAPEPPSGKDPLDAQGSAPEAASDPSADHLDETTARRSRMKRAGGEAA